MSFSEHKGFDTILVADLIGDPANYFRGHYDFLSSAGGGQTVNTGEVVKINTLTTGSGTVGHFYERLGGTIGPTDLQAIDYTVTAAWKDLGTDRAGSWVTEGVFGTPLLVDEDGNSLIPDGTSKTFKMSRKVVDGVLRIFSTDNGNTWTVSATGLTDIEGSTNAHTFSAASGSVFLYFYTTKANPTELAANSEVLALGDVFATVGAGAGDWVSALIGKIPINGGSGRWKDESPVKAIIDDPSTTSTQGNWGKISYGSNTFPRHETLELVIPLSPYPSTAKALPYLSREDGRAWLHVLYKEMVYDTTVDTSGEFTSITEATTTKTAGESYKVTDGLFEGYWRWKITTAAQLTASAFYEVDGNLYYDKIANGVFATRWDGNGWGDDNTFTVLDNESTETDDNGNTIIVGQKRIALPYFIGEGE